MDTELKRRKRSPAFNSSFAGPSSKTQRVQSPQPIISAIDNHNHALITTKSHNVQSSAGGIHENKHNVSCSYLYDANSSIPSANLTECASKSIEVRIEIKSLSPKENSNINRRLLWGGEDGLYSSDSDAVCILYHLGIASEHGLDCDWSSDQNTNQDFEYMYIRKSRHKMTANEIEEEQKRNLLQNKTMLGVAVVFKVIPGPLSVYGSMNANGY